MVSLGASQTAAPAKDSGPSIKLEGFTQTTMIKTEDNDAFVFGFERIRFGARGKLNDFMDYRLVVDFVNTSDETDKSGEEPGIVKFAQVTVKPYKSLRITAGKFKTPIGMEWNTAATKLDFIKRGLLQALIFHFDTGAMVYADELGKSKFGFAAGAFNSGPNNANAVGDPAEGQDYTVAGKLSVDPIEAFHAQVGFGSALTSIAGQKNVNLLSAAVRANLVQKLCLKGEFLLREDAQNAAADGNDFYLQAGYLVHPMFEPVVKYEKLNVSDAAKDQGTLTFGLNFYLNSKKRHESEISLNYVASDLDGKDAVQLQFQGAF
jgi:hypothetical protein